MRVVQIADDAEVFFAARGRAAVVDMLRSRRGTEFDPTLVDLCVRHADSIFAEVEEAQAWASMLASCPDLDRRIPSDELDSVLEIFADYADLKSPWYLGHSRAVATLAADAARASGCDETDVALVRRAGLVHRLGATGVSTSLWNKAGRLTTAEVERVRQVPYLTERVLARQPALAVIGSVAGMAFERVDGSGYPRGVAGAAIPPTARVLAAAVAYQDLAEARPSRPALTADERRAWLLAEAEDGRLDGPAVRAVLQAAGHPVGRRVPRVAGLTAREVDVLRLLVRGSSNKQIAGLLSITPRTVSTHIEHIFAKTGVSTRGAAAMFALRHGVVDPGQRSDDHPTRAVWSAP